MEDPLRPIDPFAEPSSSSDRHKHNKHAHNDSPPHEINPFEEPQPVRPASPRQPQPLRPSPDQQQQQQPTSASTGYVEYMDQERDQEEDDNDGPHRRDTSCLARLVPHGGSLSGMANLASCTLGAGIIALPYAYRLSGVVMGSLSLCLIAAATVYSIHVLVRTGERTNLRSYEEMAKVLVGHRVDYLTAFLMFFFCFGTCVAYVIALGDIVEPVIHGSESLPTFFSEGDWGRRVLVVIIWFCFMLPMSLQKEINAIRYFSTVAVTLILFFLCVMVYHAITYGFDSSHLGRLRGVQDGMSAVEGLSLFMFAFMCQINAFEVYFEMRPRSVARMTQDASLSMSVCCLLYLIAGFFGYLDFGDDTRDAVLKNYNPRSDVVVAIAFCGITFKLCVGFSLCILPARDAIFYAFQLGEYHRVSTQKRLLVCSTMSISALLLGLFIPAINIVFGVLGSLVGGLVGFALPAIFVMKSEKNWGPNTDGMGHFLATWLLLLGGVITFVVGTIASIYDIATK